MNVKTILLPVDFSPCGEKARALASTLAAKWGAKLVIVHVEPAPLVLGGGEMHYGMAEPIRHVVAQQLSQVRPTEPNVVCEHRLMMGEPAESILRAAQEAKADMIVMGTHGRTGLTRLLMGSVAEAVVREAKCPVLTLKQPAEAHAAA